eukprot:gnl/MRDRNA2_/MRDRNA2_51717_c0_seq2.p1 gnl/MRDRNA2_/MRDRNA2_51717_c0~~gnl/MRDRNA2_/MRDRNA2_51717_c0_seq2.p1  ORF type:complete len:519 (-),score=93.14 gnl/MRDRNA2_/MRDRNA2_51717_c0_seq2:132-1688(-)
MSGHVESPTVESCGDDDSEVLSPVSTCSLHSQELFTTTDIEVADEVAWLMAPVAFPKGISHEELSFHHVRALVFIVAIGVSSEGGSWPNLLDSILMADCARRLGSDIIHLWAQCTASHFKEGWTKAEQAEWLAALCLIKNGIDEKDVELSDVLATFLLCIRQFTQEIKETVWQETLMSKATLERQIKICKRRIKVVAADEGASKLNPFSTRVHEMVFQRAGIRGVSEKCWQIVLEGMELGDEWTSGIDIHCALKVNNVSIGIGGTAAATQFLHGGTMVVAQQHVVAGATLAGGVLLKPVAAAVGLGMGATWVSKKLQSTEQTKGQALTEAAKIWALWRDNSPLKQGGNSHRLLGWNNFRVKDEEDVIEVLIEQNSVPKGSIKFELTTSDHIFWTKEIIILQRSTFSEGTMQIGVPASPHQFSVLESSGALEQANLQDEEKWSNFGSKLETMTCQDDLHSATSRIFSSNEFPDGVIGVEIRKAKWLGLVTTLETRSINAAEVDGCTVHFFWLKVSPMDV